MNVIRGFDFSFKKIETSENIANLNSEVQSLYQGNLSPTIIVQQPRTKTLKYGSVFDKKALKTKFVEGV